jgi:GT2 family glycosyltransferase/glycosyltransferase involved in cell wall biosynthesis
MDADIADDPIGLVRRSGLFDPAWYLRQYPDVASLGMDPIEHYLKVGATLLRDPCQHFSTRFYLKANPDVAAASLNPLIHYISRGRRERRAPSPGTQSPVDFAPRVDIIVTVHEALAYTKACLTSVRDRRDDCVGRIIVVNDGSGRETTGWLREFCRTAPFELIEHGRNLGYTRSLNAGMRATTAPYVVALNSDTLVARGWLRGLIRCIESKPGIGIAGPLSNAASWQNVPDLRDASGEFAVNELPEGVDHEAMARIVARTSRREYPRMPFVNGFCFMVTRAVIDAIGCMDEVNFPLGYGEENDYCIRAVDAGFSLAIADDAYVFHAKSSSFGHRRRAELSHQGMQALKRKHTPAKVRELLLEARRTVAMDHVRQRVRHAIGHRGDAPPLDLLAIRVLFLLPVGGGGGGAHSVVQEAMAMRRLGVQATVAVQPDRVRKFRAQYPDVPGAEDLFVGFDDSNLLALAAGYDVVVGTIYWSMAALERVVRAFPHILPAYYVQDYEPLFAAEGSRDWEAARASYTLVPDAVLFAKTHWIIGKVGAEHGVAVHKVEPSIDHAVYRPIARQSDGRIHVVAMIRPHTPRRGAERTMRVLSRLAGRCPDTLVFHLFGCAPGNEHFRRLETGFAFKNHGALLRPEVASLLGHSDVFVDLSDYQAFGRTAVEAMACGCVAVVPVHGGTDEYATPDNAVVVDPFDEDACVDELERLVGDPGRLRRLRAGGLLAAARYTPHGAAVSELAVLGEALVLRRRLHPVPGGHPGPG